MKLTLQLSCYNGATYLPFVFAGLRAQTTREWRLLILDNASREDEAALIRQAVADASDLPIELFRVDPNIGFAGAHNYLFEKHKQTSEVVMLLNDDAVLEPTFLADCLAELQRHDECGSVSGAVYRWNFEERDSANKGKTSMLDTIGLRQNVFGRVFDVGAGKTLPIAEFPKQSFATLGVSGCLPMYRVSAVLEASPWGTLFDPHFRIYKEDVDLALRLRTLGYSARIVPAALAYHRRSYKAKVLDTKRPINEGGYYSYRNHLWILIAHTPIRSLFWSKIGVVLFEKTKAFYWMIRKPAFLWQAWKETWQARVQLLEKRRWLQKMKQVHANGLRPVSPSMSETVDLAIIMVTHNDASAECLRSLAEAKAQSPLKIQVVIADNNSKDKDVHPFVKQYLPDAWILLRNGDYGFGRSCNRAAEQVKARYYFFLNPDTVLTDPKIFDTLVAQLKADPTIGLIAPKVLYFDGRLQETCRRFPRWFMPFVQRIPFFQNTKWGSDYAAQFAMRDYSHETALDVDWVQGSAMLITGPIWHLIGGFDHRFWLYFEDIDLCRRVHLAGKRVVYEPATVLKHAHGKESAKIRNFLLNILLNEAARAHLWSWFLYSLKWI